MPQVKNIQTGVVSDYPDDFARQLVKAGTHVMAGDAPITVQYGTGGSVNMSPEEYQKEIMAGKAVGEVPIEAKLKYAQARAAGKQYEGAGYGVAAGVLAGADFLSGGLTTLANHLQGADQTTAAIQEQHPISTIAGSLIGGALSAGIGSGAAAAKAAGAASTLTKIGGALPGVKIAEYSGALGKALAGSALPGSAAAAKIASSLIEGGAYGAQQQASYNVIHDVPITAESIAHGAGLGAIFNGALTVGGIGIGKAGQAYKNARNAANAKALGSLLGAAPEANSGATFAMPDIAEAPTAQTASGGFVAPEVQPGVTSIADVNAPYLEAPPRGGFKAPEAPAVERKPDILDTLIEKHKDALSAEGKAKQAAPWHEHFDDVIETHKDFDYVTSELLKRAKVTPYEPIVTTYRFAKSNIDDALQAAQASGVQVPKDLFLKAKSALSDLRFLDGAETASTGADALGRAKTASRGGKDFINGLSPLMQHELAGKVNNYAKIADAISESVGHKPMNTGYRSVLESYADDISNLKPNPELEAAGKELEAAKDRFLAKWTRETDESVAARAAHKEAGGRKVLGTNAPRREFYPVDKERLAEAFHARDSAEEAINAYSNYIEKAQKVADLTGIIESTKLGQVREELLASWDKAVGAGNRESAQSLNAEIRKLAGVVPQEGPANLPLAPEADGALSAFLSDAVMSGNAGKVLKEGRKAPRGFYQESVQLPPESRQSVAQGLAASTERRGLPSAAFNKGGLRGELTALEIDPAAARKALQEAGGKAAKLDLPDIAPVAEGTKKAGPGGAVASAVGGAVGAAAGEAGIKSAAIGTAAVAVGGLKAAAKISKVLLKATAKKGTSVENAMRFVKPGLTSVNTRASVSKVLSNLGLGGSSPSDSPQDAYRKEAEAIRYLAANPKEASDGAFKALAPVRAVHAEVGDKSQGHAERVVTFLASKLPKNPARVLTLVDRFQPSREQIEKFADYVDGALNPIGVMERALSSKGSISVASAEALRVCNPAHFAKLQEVMVENLDKIQSNTTYDQQNRMSVLFGVPINSHTTQESVQFMQSDWAARNQPGKPVQVKQSMSPEKPTAAQQSTER